MLAGLPAVYDTVVTVLETSADRDVSLDDILPKLMPVEQRVSQTGFSRPDETALAAKRFGNHGNNQRHKETRTCYVCGEAGHIAKNCHKKSHRGLRGYNTIAL